MKDNAPSDFSFHYGEYGNHAISCSYEGKRYHINLESDLSLRPDSDLYCNPGLNEDGSYKRPLQDGYFRTRRLSVGRETGKFLVPILLEKAKELFPQAEREFREAQRAKEDERKARIRSNRKLLRAEEMYELMTRARNEVVGPQWRKEVDAIIDYVEGVL